MNTVTAFIALVLCSTIVGRCIAVLYRAVPHSHRHPLQFLGFGYSYVTLGAGAISGGLALVLGLHDLADVALWLMLSGSVGLIAFDRRAVHCITSGEDCPLESARRRRP